MLLAEIGVEKLRCPTLAMLEPFPEMEPGAAVPDLFAKLRFRLAEISYQRGLTPLGFCDPFKEF
jgi:hypothetical protein